MAAFIGSEIEKPGGRAKKRFLDDLLGGFKWWRLEK
jgi:hypothetical protein